MTKRKREKITLGGVPVTVVSEAEAETVDYVVCMPDGPSKFDDNLTGFCAHCGTKIMFRWHVPRKPKKICLNCANKLAETLPGKRKKVTGAHE
jgi:hypothetical protein